MFVFARSVTYATLFVGLVLIFLPAWTNKHRPIGPQLAPFASVWLAEKVCSVKRVHPPESPASELLSQLDLKKKILYHPLTARRPTRRHLPPQGSAGTGPQGGPQASAESTAHRRKTRTALESPCLHQYWPGRLPSRVRPGRRCPRRQWSPPPAAGMTQAPSPLGNAQGEKGKAHRDRALMSCMSRRGAAPSAAAQYDFQAITK